MALLNKLFTPVGFILVNLAIIIMVELAGGGMFFYETGFIHALAIIFILLNHDMKLSYEDLSLFY